MTDKGSRPTLAVWKFASCDGCQLSLLDCEDELLAVAESLTIAHFPEALRPPRPPAAPSSEGPFDISLVEGSITTPEDAARIRHIREVSASLVAIGACATSGGIQALRNSANVQDFVSAVYAHPEHISALETSTPIAAHVQVDLELRGCPISKAQLLESVGALLQGRRPALPTYSLCIDCKRKGHLCVSVAHGKPCMGPVTQAGCGAICPSYHRGCYGCFGPQETPNLGALVRWWRHALGVSTDEARRLAQTFNVAANGFEYDFPD